MNYQQRATEQLRPVGRFARASIFAVALLTFVGAFDCSSLFAELINSFRIQLALLGVFSIVGFRRRELWLAVPLGTLLAILNISPVIGVRSYLKTTLLPEVASTDGIILASLNIMGRTMSVDSLDATISRLHADVLVLQEFEKRHASTPTLARYNFSIERGGELDFGIAVYSVYPIVAASAPSAKDTNLEVTLDVRGRTLKVLAVHLLPPATPAELSHRNRQLLELANATAREDDALLLVGDFNVTPFSPRYTEFIQRAGVQDARGKLGLAPSWPAFLPPLWVPIDHAFVNSKLRFVDVQRGSIFWSDHFPLVLKVALAEPSL